MKGGRAYGIPRRRLRRRRNRRGPRRDRGRSGRRKARRTRDMLYHKFRRRGQYALQPRDRRNGEGPPRARARLPRRRDGKGGGQSRHTVQDAEQGQGPCRPLAQSAGGQVRVPPDNEGRPRKAAGSPPYSGRDQRYNMRGRARHRGCDCLRRRIRGEGRRNLHRHLP